MFEKIKAFFNSPKVKAFLEGPPRRPSPAELLFELANDANRRDAAKAAVERVFAEQVLDVPPLP